MFVCKCSCIGVKNKMKPQSVVHWYVRIENIAYGRYEYKEPPEKNLLNVKIRAFIHFSGITKFAVSSQCLLTDQKKLLIATWPQKLVSDPVHPTDYSVFSYNGKGHGSWWDMNFIYDNLHFHCYKIWTFPTFLWLVKEKEYSTKQNWASINKIGWRN